jgi:hypothetical protein
MQLPAAIQAPRLARLTTAALLTTQQQNSHVVSINLFGPETDR